MIFEVLFLVFPVILSILGFPVFGAKYGEHWEIIQLLSLFFLNVYFWLDMSMRITHFARTEYLFYKSAGLGSSEILLKYLKSNSRFVCFCSGLVFVCIYDGHLVENTIAWLQWVILTAALTMIIYEILHLRRRIIFGIVGYCVVGVVFVLLIKEIVQSGATGMNRWSLYLVTNIGIMTTLRNLLLEVNMVVLIVAVVLFLLAAITLSTFDDKIIDGLKNSSIKARFLNKRHNKSISPSKSRVVIELKRLINLKAYVFAVILEYIFAFLGIVFSLKLSTQILWWFYLFAALGGLLAEAFYTLDIPCKLMYRMLGLEFKSFFTIKLKTLFLAEIPIFIIYGLGAVLGCISTLELIIVVAMLLINLFSMNAFYASKYLHMSYKNGARYVIDSILMGVVAFVPIVNLVAGVFLYRLSEKRWRAHVGD